jgi:tetratricopeptide (TPR) repeat protein
MSITHTKKPVDTQRTSTGAQNPPALKEKRQRATAINWLALARADCGEVGVAADLHQRATELFGSEDNLRTLAVSLRDLSGALCHSGALRKSHAWSRECLTVIRRLEAYDKVHQTCNALLAGFLRSAEESLHEGAALEVVAISMAACGKAEASVVLPRAEAIFQRKGGRERESLAQCYLWLSRNDEALESAKRSWDSGVAVRYESQMIRAARTHGCAALARAELTTAGERLHEALTRARAINLVEEQLPALKALAELHRQRKEYDVARELLEEVWAPAERGPYPLWHADARNVLAQLERDLGHRDAGIEAATAAYRLAWCDGPPYAYHYGLTNARRHLHELGAPEPQLPPFDETQFPPMPYVELNPRDEFYVD